MVNHLDRKVLRDLMRMKTQVITISLVIASGVAALISSMSTHDSLKRAQSHFYYEGRFADIFAELKRAPLSLEQRLSEIPGVLQVETRIVKDYLLHIPHRVEPAVGHFISIPENNVLTLNKLYLKEGRLLDPRHSEEVIISEGFAKANAFRPGDRIAAIINGKYKELTIVGTALSPEHIYAIRQETTIPNDREYGIFWMSRKALEAALDMEGSFNSLSLILGPESSGSAVIAELDRILLPYGGLGAYERKDQVSHRFLSDDIAQNRVMAVAIPLVFLAVSAFLLNVVISRLVSLQRSQIGTLKAVGYSDLNLTFHYLKMITVIVFLGSVLGVGLGIWMGRELTRLYTDFYRFPVAIFFVKPSLPLLAGGVSYLAALIGGYAVMRQVFKMAPAEAMRPPAPPAFQHHPSERLRLTRFLSTEGKIVFRNLTIRPVRTLLGLLGIAFAIMVIMLGLFWWDTVHYIIYAQFSLTQREDTSIHFAEHVPEHVLWELEHYPGVVTTEGYRTIPIRLRHMHHHRPTALLGYPRQSKLRLLLDKELRRMTLPPEGLLLSKLLARKLQAEPGDWVEVEVLEGKRQKWSLRTAGVVDQWVGYAAYMELTELQALLDDDLISMATLDIDAKYKNALYSKLKDVPTIAVLSDKGHLLQMFEQTMIRFLLVYAGVLTVFALAIAVGVVYNSARVSLSERARELMSLRVLGFSKNEVFKILGGEISFQLLCAMPLGWLLGYLFAALMIWLMHTETFAIPLVIERETFAIASVSVLVSGLLSALVVRRRLNAMDLVSALKVPE